MKVEDIKNPLILKTLTNDQLELLAQDIRTFLIENISKTGGHLSSNLGIVELTMALHYVFDSPNDKIFFDVGHQSYVHKILTGRAKDFTTLRQFDGLSGFQKRCESEHDVWEAGHSSTAISAAVAMAVSRDLNLEDFSVVPVVGDASITSGESLEAINHLGSLPNKVIIILNDNEMAIGKSVGGFNEFLSSVRTSHTYNQLKDDYRSFLQKGKVGTALYQTTKSVKDFFKHSLMDDTIFEDFGLAYYGPIDGHNFTDLINVLTLAKKSPRSIVIHVKTIKGKGYSYAQQDTDGSWHGTGPFDIETGKKIVKKTDAISWSKVVSHQVQLHMRQDNDVVAISPAMVHGSAMDGLFKEFPERCFDVGIAEEHAVTFAASLSLSGKKPFISIYSSFMQRAYDQLNHEFGRMHLPGLLSIDRAGIVGSDGPTHHGVFDIGLLLPIPHFVIFAPKDVKECKQYINTAFINNDTLYALRIPRGNVLDEDVDTNDVIEIGTWENVFEDDEYDLTIVTYGVNVNQVITHHHQFPCRIRLVNARFLKPMDEEMLNDIAKSHKPLVVYETDLKINSLQTMMSYYYMQHHINVDLYGIGIGDHYSPQGTIEQIYQIEHVDIQSVIKKCEDIVGNEKRKN